MLEICLDNFVEEIVLENILIFPLLFREFKHSWN